VSSLLPGDSFGEIAVLHGVARTATITAVESLRTCQVPAELFLDGGAGGEFHGK
jgi:CRP-like cAMP-binding protein